MWRSLPAALLCLSGAVSAGPARFEHFTYSGVADEHPAVSAAQYRNPILSGYYPDPSITRVGDNYYLVNSSFAHFPGLPIFTSKNLVDWRQIGNAIDRPTQVDLTGRAISEGLFAPDISYQDGRFFLINTCVNCGGNFIITARDPAGPWSDPVWLGLEGIDPSIFWEAGRAYIVNNRPPNGPAQYDGHHALWLQEFDWRAGCMVGESTQVVDGGVDTFKQPSWIEGPHLFKRNGLYYLIAAEGGTGDMHSEVVFRSHSLHGPYSPFRDSPILSQRTLDTNRPHPVTSAGHADFVRTPAGDWWATFLATRPYSEGKYNIGRETFLLPVTWRGGWPSILPASTAVPFVARRPALPHGVAVVPPTSGDFSYVERFDSATLPPQWIGIRTPKAPVYQLDGGGLVLDKGAALGDRGGVPAFVGRRQQHHVATVTVTLIYAPEREGDRAGLAAIQSDESFLFYGLTRLQDRPAVTLFVRSGQSQEAMIASAPIEAGSAPIVLSIGINRGLMSFAYRRGSSEQTLVSDVDGAFLSTQSAGGFVGTVIGAFARNQ